MIICGSTDIAQNMETVEPINTQLIKIQESGTLFVTCSCWVCSEMTKVAEFKRDCKQQKQHSLKIIQLFLL